MTKQPQIRLSDEFPAGHRLPAWWVAACLLIAPLNPLAAQDDPFAVAPPRGAAQATNPSESDAPQLLPEIPSDTPESTRLVIESIRRANPVTLEGLTRSLRTLLDLGQYAEAKYYLARIQDQLSDDSARLKFQQLAGADLMFEVRMRPELQPLGSSIAESTLAGAKRAAYDPSRLDSLIDQLSDDSSAVRANAFRELRRLGAPAAARIVSRFADDRRQPEFPNLREALQKMGSSAVVPLAGAARAPVARVQLEALRALTAYREPAARDALFRALLWPQELPEPLRSELPGSPESQANPADREIASETLRRRAWDLLTGRETIPEAARDQRTLWRWNPEAAMLTPIELPVETVARVRSAGLASDLYRLDPENAESRKLFLLTQLEASKRLVGNRASLELSRLEKILPGLDLDELDRALGTAIRLELYPAAAGACELIGQIGSSSSLAGTAGRRSNLVEALLTGNRHVQFSAFQAIDQIDPEMAYEGSSYMTMLAAFMASGGGPPQAVVAHHLEDYAQSTAVTMEQLGYAGVAASSSRELFELATSRPDVDLLLISDTLQQPDVIQLTQQLRRDSRTRQLPVGIVVSSQKSALRIERVFRNQPGVWIIPEASDTALLQLHVQDMESVLQEWPVTAVDRQRHAYAAIEWLTKVAEDRERYAFYDLGSQQALLTELIYVPGFTREAAKILTALGTPDAQREMLNFASQSNLPLDERQPVVDAFIESVRRSGTLLTTEEIQMQYDRYNASQYESESSQELLGSILDAIESRAQIRQ